CALVMTAIAGHDPMDSTSAPRPIPDFTQCLKADLKGMRIGIPKEYFVTGIEPGVERRVREALRELEGLGARLVDVSLPSTDYALGVYYLIQPAEASANLARYDGVRFGLRVEGRAY
ncbi:MAG: amidase family protein, partial [Chloroflexota bacterium]